jgi:hypothetical protein
VERIDQRRIDLKQRLAPGQHAERPSFPRPQRARLRRQRRGRITSAMIAIHADEIGIAELAHRLRAILFAPRPEIASGKADEHRAPPRLHAFALQRQEHLLDGIAHGAAA